MVWESPLRRTIPECGPESSGSPRVSALWHAVAVSDAPSDSTDPTSDVEVLVPEWLSVPEVAERLGLRLADVRRLIEDRELLSHRIGERRAVGVPAGFIDDEGPLHALKGTFTVLADGGMSDEEVIRWLHTTDPTLPGGGTPLDAIRAGFKTEVRRRAMEEAF